MSFKLVVGILLLIVVFVSNALVAWVIEPLSWLNRLLLRCEHRLNVWVGFEDECDGT